MKRALQIEPAGAAKCRLADGKPFTIGGLELLNRAFVVHLHEPDPEKGQLASRRFAPELDRAADRATAANVGGAERSGMMVVLNPVCVGWQRHGSNVSRPPGHRSAEMRSRIDGTLPKMTRPLMPSTVAIATGTAHASMF